MIPIYNRAAIIYNPHAGKLKKGRAHRLVRAAETLRTLAQDVILIPTNGPRTAGLLAMNAINEGADLIVAAGGDGTISEVVNGMANSQVPLAILPAGTANVLAHEIGLRRDVIAAAKQLAACTPIRVSLGEVLLGGSMTHESRPNKGLPQNSEPHRFLLMAGAGFDAEIVYQLSAGWKDRLGKLSYFLGGIGRVGPPLNEFEVEIDNQRHKGSLVLISKVRNYGGDFEIATRVSLRDNQFEVVLFEGRNSWRYLRYLFGVATRTLDNTPGVQSFRTAVVQLHAENAQVRLQADGEMIGTLPAKIQILPDALTLLIPPVDRR